MTRPKAQRTVAFAAVAIAAFATTCGGRDGLSKAEYEDKLQQTAADIDSSFDRLSSALSDIGRKPGALEHSAKRVTQVQDEIDAAADELESLDPPADAERAHRELVNALRILSRELRAFHEAVAASDVDRLEEFAEGVDALEAIPTIERATERLQSAGYDIEDVR